MKRYIDSPKSIYPLVTFRVVFGILMMFSTARFVALDWIEDHYTDPLFHFKYYGFEWIEPLGLTGMYAVHFILFLAALFVTMGLCYRIASIVLFLTFTYTELIDLTYYLNHYYFVSLICFLLIFLPAHRAVSLDVRLGITRFTNVTPAWTIDSIKLMIGIVYTYAGLAKINTDWLLHALPLKIWLPAHDKLPIIGSIFTWSITPYIFSWFGMLYDTTIVWFLLWKRTRWIAYLTVLFFHVMTGLLFQIGVFPLVMICSNLIFFSDRLHKWIWRIKNNEVAQSIHYTRRSNTLIKTVFVLFFIFQIFFPWRYLLYPGNVFWHEQGYRFSWRVMLMEKSGTATFFIKNADDQKERIVINSDFLNPHQEKQMAFQPDMILQYAHFLQKWHEAKGISVDRIRCESYVTLNGRPSTLIIHKDIDLCTQVYSWTSNPWITKHDQGQ